MKTLAMILLLAGMSQGQTKNLVVTPAGQHSVVLTWTNGTSTGGPLTSNKVYRSLVSGGQGTVIFASTSVITTYTDTTVVGGTTYFFTVTDSCATCNPQESVKSNEAQAVIPGDQPQPPTGLSAQPN